MAKKKKGTGAKSAKKSTATKAPKIAKAKTYSRKTSPKSAAKKVKTQKKITSKKAKPKAPASKKKALLKEPDQKGFPIVAIGASAGGLEAYEAFFKSMPSDSGMAFILVAHLDPSHVSLLPELIQNRTKMEARQAKDGMKVQVDHIYIIPPNKDLRILNGVLQLLEFTQPRAVNMPIDSFFRSLAQDQGANAICIILSGTGTDGTLGLKAIKGEGGMAMVQDEESAKYDGMPRSAIATNLADYVLSPQKMPKQLIQYTKHTGPRILPMGTNSLDSLPNALQKVLLVLRSRTKNDFTLYKKNTICRRIERRMKVHQIEHINDYVRHLQESEREVDILFKELLIGVTNFFRDPEAFEFLKKKALPKLLREKSEGYHFRAWVPGCSTGEEAYSLAILLSELMEESKHSFNVQIFGTDIDEDAINTARAGLYPPSISVDISPVRLKRFFGKEDNGAYRIKKNIREMLIFAPQNLIKHPPFTKLDLLSCRNLLIYLDAELQKKLLPIFHYSLKPGGILFLGTSETIGQSLDLFKPLEKKLKIFSNGPVSGLQALEFPPGKPERQDEEIKPPASVKKAKELDSIKLLEAVLKQSDVPPCAIIENNLNIVYIHGRTGRFLEPAEGKISVNILEMARPGLKKELSAAIRKVDLQKREVALKGIRIRHNGDHLYLNLTVKPIFELGAARNLMMVIFNETGLEKHPKEKKLLPPPNKETKTVEELEAELQYTKEDLQSTIEELETANEELKSTNEELQSTNEELQSTNEEMETSKEELQSLNEESTTVNAELQGRIEELDKTHDDMKNLLDSTHIATIFLDTELCIQRFTPKTTKIIPLSGSDSGRPIKHFATTLLGTNLDQQAAKVLDDLMPIEKTVEDKEGHFFLMRLRPYRTVNNVIDGVVITFEDITKIKEAEWAQRLATVLRDSNDAITVLDFNGDILEWNRGAKKMYGYTEIEAKEMNLTDFVPKIKKTETVNFMKKIRKAEVKSFETQRLTKDGRRLDVWLTVTKIMDKYGKPIAVATTERDISNITLVRKR